MKRLWALRSIISRVGLALLLAISAYALLWLVRWLFFGRFPFNTLPVFLSLWALSYIVISGLIWARKKLSWSLRNQMAAVYIFIAVVPVLLVVTMVGLGAYLLYWQLGSYVLYTEMQTRVQRVATVAGGLATTLAIEATATGRPVPTLPIPTQTQGFLESAKADIPGLQVEIGIGEALLARTGSDEATGFKGIVLTGKQLALRAVAVRPVRGGKVVVSVSAPITPELLETLAPELGPIRFLILQPAEGNSVPGEIVTLNGQRLTVVERIVTEHRSEPRAANVFDKRIGGLTSLDLVDLREERTTKGEGQLHAAFVTRPSLLNRRLFGHLGYLGSSAVTLLTIVGAIFLVLELAALATGIFLTRAITSSVDNLYIATQHVQSGDLSFRVRVHQRDELGALGDSFNSMMQSIGTLIDEQRERQRLENELSIAREVQTQLFPPELPSIPGAELEAICRPARMVSGDYYDFIRIGPTRLAIVLADISGKGISAALLMASLQATLRGELLRDGQGEQLLPNTAEIVAHLNRHLFLNTSEERYATLFLAIYDAFTGRLSYTNAGHLSPFYIVGDRMEKLETGDTVIGLFSEVQFRQATINIEQEGLLVIYSDGLTEPENALGEAFGSDRLAENAMRLRDESPHVIAQTILSAAEEWRGSDEQADDLTVVVARLSRPVLRKDSIEGGGVEHVTED
jgi:phosphoserine phosphatase RsbU/P